MAAEILQEDRPAQHSADHQRAGGHDLGRGLADYAAAQPGDDRGDDRQENDEEDWVHQPRIRLTSSTAIEPRRRKKMTRIANPIAASGAATGSKKMANTCPVRSPKKALNATRLMFTLSRISSIAISIRMMFRRLRKMPSTPIVNRIAATAR